MPQVQINTPGHFAPAARFAGLRRLAGGLATLFLIACSKAPLYQQEGFVFGTRVEVLIAGIDETQARPAAAEVLREFDRLHRRYHAWQASELSDLNAALAAGKTFSAPPEMATLLTDAQHFSAASDGLFDPGIGRLIALWGFQSDDYPNRRPEPARLAAWRAARPGIADLRIAGQKISSRNRQLSLDLGGYLKGYALDRATTLLHARGIDNALINIGGNVMALGSKNGEAWRVGIRHPRQSGAIATIALGDGEAIGTSGDYQRYFTLDGTRYCHLLDPHSALPVDHTQALTVLISPRTQAGTLSDMASKPLFIAGRDWLPMARRLGLDHILRIDATGRVEVTQALQRRLEFSPGNEKNLQIIP